MAKPAQIKEPPAAGAPAAGPTLVSLIMAMAVLTGSFGTVAANSNTMMPTHDNVGIVGLLGTGSQWPMTPAMNAWTIM